MGLTRCLSINIWGNFLLITLFLCSQKVFGEENNKLTPSEIENLPNDTLKFEAYLELGDTFFNDNLDSAEFYYLKAEKIARKINDKQRIIKFIRYNILVLNREGRYNEALKLTQESLAIAKNLNELRSLTTSYNNLANEYSYLGNLKLAAFNYLQGLKYAQQLKDLNLLQKLSNNLASVFLELKETNKSFNYAKRSLDYARKMGDPKAIASSLVNISNCETYRKNYKKAEEYLLELISLSRKLDDITYTLDAYINLGHIATEQKNYSKALLQFLKAEEILGKEKIPDYQLYVGWGLAQSHFYLGSYKQANKFLLESIEVAKSIQALNELRQLYELGADINEKLNNSFLALAYLKKFKTLNDSLINEETQENIHKLEIEYQTSLKEKAIAEQKLTIAQNNIELQQKNLWITFAILAIMILVFAIAFVYLVYKNKQKAIKERMILLEKDRQLQVLEAMMAGEEKERSRLAKELHDGIGGLLSATKMHLSILKNEQSKEQPSQFDHTLGMLDNASKEIRSIAHNLAPEILIKQGLDVALNKFCQRVSNSSLHIDYYCIGEIAKLNRDFELIVYRIVQELVNNIIKHSQATNGVVQLSHHNDVLSITVEDNGVGFETGNSNGIGMQNMESRVRGINGEINISSEPGNGTTIYIEFETSRFKIVEAQKVDIY